MTKPAELYFGPRPQSSHDRHVQESGYDGYSSNMEHKFSDNYSENSFPVADEGSFVIPIPKGELDDYEHPKKPGKISLPPMMYEEPAAAPKEESHPVTHKKGFLKPSTAAVAQKNNFPSRATKISRPDNNPEEEVAKLAEAKTTTVSKEEPVKEVVGDGSIIDINVDTRGTPGKTKGPPLVTGKRMSRERRKKRAAGKNRKMYLLCLVLCMCAPVSEGSPAGARLAADQNFKCFVCMDKDRCPNLTHIFINENEKPEYERPTDSTIPRCCGITPTNNMTVVCRNQSDIIIICPEGAGKVEAEDTKQLPISAACTYEDITTCGRARDGLIAGVVVVFLIVVAASVILWCCRKKKSICKEQMRGKTNA